MDKNKKRRKDFKKKLLELLDSSSEEENEIPLTKKRRRIISDSEESDEENIPPPQEKIIPASLLEKIGHVQQNDNTFVLHKDIKMIWEEVLKKGLEKETKEAIMKKIAGIKDCFTAAPILNQEIKVTLSAQAQKRDEHLCEKQTQIGAAVCGLSELLQDMIDGKAYDDDSIEKISNYIRLLCDVHNMESQTRRAVILPGLNKNLKDSLERTDIGENLFGKNLTDIIREARTLEKSKKDLTKEKPQSLNNWGLSGGRKQGGPPRQSNFKYQPPPAVNRQPTTYQQGRQRQQRQQFRAMVKPQQRQVPRRAPPRRNN